MSAERVELFSPIPKHVMGDKRLTAGHWRLLAAIAWHSRFDDNGRGCYAKHSVLAEEADIDYANVSHFAAELAAWGIITSERFHLDRRCRIYRLIFKEKKAIGGEPNTYSAGADEHSDKHGEPAKYFPEIGGRQKEEVADSQQESASQYIPLNGRGKYDVETFSGRNSKSCRQYPVESKEKASPTESRVDRNPKTKWENLLAKAST